MVPVESPETVRQSTMMGGHIKSGSVCLSALLALAGSVWLPVVDAGQIPSAAYFLLQPGMSEAEVLVRAGPPDLVTSPGLEAVEVESGIVHKGKKDEENFDKFISRTRSFTLARWQYVPGPHEPDPHLTIITFRAGEVLDVERIKVFSRYTPPAGESGVSPDEGRVRRSDRDVRLERIDNTLEAAEVYSATRAKLKDRSESERSARDAEQASEETITIYRSVQPDGSVYFGDSPPGQSPKIIRVP